MKSVISSKINSFLEKKPELEKKEVNTTKKKSSFNFALKSPLNLFKTKKKNDINYININPKLTLKKEYNTKEAEKQRKINANI
jgi:hypothetical protein